jgi:hypothetical protein
MPCPACRGSGLVPADDDARAEAEADAALDAEERAANRELRKAMIAQARQAAAELGRNHG